jgi:hypothetical protein
MEKAKRLKAERESATSEHSFQPQMIKRTGTNNSNGNGSQYRLGNHEDSLGEILHSLLLMNIRYLACYMTISS